MQDLPQAKLFVEGRYKKLSRDLPQTVFFCPECKGHPRRRRKCERCEGFGKLSRDSVQELAGWVLGKAMGTRKNKFHGAGREDVDVRMLGDGRPFILEFLAPKVFDVDLAALEQEINRRNEGRMEVLGLHWTEKARVRVIKEAEHAKEYRAWVRIDEGADIDALHALVGQKFTVAQGTPQRVAHRRADKIRERWVEFLAVAEDPEQENTYIVDLRCQHGTYVKEVVGGESGRTEPSLTGLVGATCVCTALDVLGILGAEGEALEEQRARPSAFGQGIYEG